MRGSVAQEEVWAREERWHERWRLTGLLIRVSPPHFPHFTTFSRAISFGVSLFPRPSMVAASTK